MLLLNSWLYFCHVFVFFQLGFDAPRLQVLQDALPPHFTSVNNLPAINNGTSRLDVYTKMLILLQV